MYKVSNFHKDSEFFTNRMRYRLALQCLFNTQETRTAMYEIESQAIKTFDHLYEDGSFLNGVAVFREGEQFEEVSIASGAVHPLALQMGAGGSVYTTDYIVHGSYEQNKRERILCYDRAARRYIWEYDVKALRYPHDLKANKEYSGEIKTILGFYRDIVIVAAKGENCWPKKIST